MEENKPGHAKSLVIALLLIILAYPAYLLLLWLANAFTMMGFNFFFFTDNLLFVRGAPPVLLWALLGGLLGSIPGTYVAIRKYRLKPVLILIPILLIVLIIALLILINRPADHNGTFAAPAEPFLEAVEVPREFGALSYTLNVRKGPSTEHPRLFVLDSGTVVEILEKGHFASNRQEWFKIRFEGQEGYVNARYVKIPAVLPE